MERSVQYAANRVVGKKGSKRIFSNIILTPPNDYWFKVRIIILSDCLDGDNTSIAGGSHNRYRRSIRFVHPRTRPFSNQRRQTTKMLKNVNTMNSVETQEGLLFFNMLGIPLHRRGCAKLK